MKTLIIFFLSCIAAFAAPFVHTPATTNDSPAAVKAWLNIQEGGSQTPWLQDVDADGRNLSNVGSIDFLSSQGTYLSAYDYDGGAFTVTVLSFTNAASSSINFSSFEISAPIDSTGNLYLRPLDGILANNGAQFFSPAGSYDVGIALANIGPVWNVQAGTGIMWFTGPNFLVGANDDDGSNSKTQITSNGSDPALSVNGTLKVSGDTIMNGNPGWSGTFITQEGETVTVENGWITNVGF